MSSFIWVFQLLEQVHLKIVMSEHLSDKQKAIICEKMAVSIFILLLMVVDLLLELLFILFFYLQVCSQRLQDGASEYLQMSDLCCAIMLCLRS